MSVARTNMTAEELLTLDLPQPCELVRGELHMMSPSGSDHSRIGIEVGRLLGNYVKPQKLGLLTGSDGGYRIERNPDTVRVPDVGFTHASRVPPGPIPGIFEGPPDLAVEVVSPTDRRKAVNEKVQMWLDAGCLAVWVVDPARQSVVVHQPDGVQSYGLADSVSVPGLPHVTLSVAEIFAP